jgi:hypothetical protein
MSVLAAGAEDGRWRPGLRASADLICSALWMRLRPGVSRRSPTVFAAVRLMYIGAVVELVTLITVVATQGSVRAAIHARHPNFDATKWRLEVHTNLLPVQRSAMIAVAVWLWLAWANGRGHGWARVAFAAFFGVNALGLLRGIAQHAAAYAPADLIAGCMLCLVAAATVALTFSSQSRSHYARLPADG